jgi:hypothetical protein
MHVTRYRFNFVVLITIQLSVTTTGMWLAKTLRVTGGYRTVDKVSHKLRKASRSCNKGRLRAVYFISIRSFFV